MQDYRAMLRATAANSAPPHSTERYFATTIHLHNIEPLAFILPREDV